MKNGRRADSVALPTLSFSESLKQHWPEYLMEAAALGIFMISAGVFTALFECPGSFVHQAITHEEVRRAMIGVAMGATANWTATWIYFTASPVGMLLAAQGYLLVKVPNRFGAASFTIDPTGAASSAADGPFPKDLEPTTLV